MMSDETTVPDPRTCAMCDAPPFCYHPDGRWFCGDHCPVDHRAALRRYREKAPDVALPLCPLCDHPVGNADDLSPTPLHTSNGPQATHRSCMLRSVMGGIGHLVAHEYWCLQRHDPDAGLTYRQSALLVDAYVTFVGIDKAVGDG